MVDDKSDIKDECDMCHKEDWLWQCEHCGVMVCKACKGKLDSETCKE